MATRHEDWLRQGRRDLEHARASLELRHFEWAAFAAQQGAENAVKALFQRMGAEARGHAVSDLLAHLPAEVVVPPGLLDRAKELDTYYIPTRYPNAHAQGTPADYYTQGTAERAITHAEAIVRFCEGHVLP